MIAYKLQYVLLPRAREENSRELRNCKSDLNCRGLVGAAYTVSDARADSELPVQAGDGYFRNHLRADLGGSFYCHLERLIAGRESVKFDARLVPSFSPSACSDIASSP